MVRERIRTNMAFRASKWYEREEVLVRLGLALETEYLLTRLLCQRKEAAQSSEGQKAGETSWDGMFDSIGLKVLQSQRLFIHLVALPVLPLCFRGERGPHLFGIKDDNR